MKLHLVGIGGAGMAPLAEIALERGHRISGSDREENAKTAALRARGVPVAIGHAAANLPPDAELLVFSSAVPPDNPERAAARRRNIPELRRGEFLGRIAAEYRRPVAVSGSHGKTSITSMLVHILRGCGRNPGYLIGGLVPGLAPGCAGDGDLFVTEADESDGTHTALHPALGIVPNADDDHSWSVGGEAALRENFHRFALQSRRLLYFRNFVRPDWFADHPDAAALDAAAIPVADYPGFAGFQRRNAALAVRAAVELGIDRHDALAAVRDFPGVARRMTVHWNTPELLIVEDYAHHPTEVANSIEWLRERHPRRHLRVLFQPHRYARLAKYLDKLATELARPDSTLILPVFAAWSESGPVGGAELAGRIGARARYLDGSWAEIARAATAPAPDGAPLLLAVIGAGDIDRVFAELPGGGTDR